MTDFRVGQGYDAHRFGDGDHVMIGGVRIPHDHGIIAHSDGDVLLHAIIDAVIGALGDGDIGRHFPDTDPKYQGIDSRVLLQETNKLMRSRGFKLCNLDATVIAQRPKLAAHIPAMEAVLAVDLAVNAEQINLKATTTERMGFTGREEGIAAMAVALLKRVD